MFLLLIPQGFWVIFGLHGGVSSAVERPHVDTAGLRKAEEDNLSVRRSSLVKCMIIYIRLGTF